jgi:eukaryotic-like serine/threonine-protein kinase
MKTYRTFFVVIISVLMLGLLTSCGGAFVNNYPGMTLDEERDVVYLAYQNGVFAVDVNTGNQVWRFPAQADGGRTFFAPPALAGERIIVGDYNNTFLGVNASNGSEVWVHHSETGHVVGSPLVVDDLILAPSGNHALYAFDQNGQIQWRFKSENVLWSRPASDGQAVYLSAMDHNIYAINKGDGSQIWKRDLSSAILGSPVLVDGTLYVVTMQSQVFAVNASDGEVIWTERPVGGEVWATPVYNDGTLYFGSSNGRVYAVSTNASSQNRILWSLDLGNPVIGGGALYDDGLIFPTEDGTAHGVSFDGQKTSLNLTVNGKLYSKPVVTDNLIILAITQGEDNRYMTAFDRNGTERWSFTLPSN